MEDWAALYDRLRDEGASHDEAVSTVEARKKLADRKALLNERFKAPPVGKAKGALGAAASAIPFGDEIGAALHSLPKLIPGGKSFSEEYSDTRDRRRREAERFAEEEPGISTGAKIVGTGLTIAPSLSLSPVAGSAMLGGLTAAGEAEGTKNRLVAGGIGAGAGAVLGKAGEVIFNRLPARLLAPALGAGIGGAHGDTPGEHVKGAVAGGVAGGAAGAVGPRASQAIIDRVRAKFGDDAVEQMMLRAVGKYGQAMQRGGSTEADILAAAASEVPGMTPMDIGPTGGPIQRLARAAESIPSKGAKEIRETLQKRSALSPSRAERTVEKAMGGSKYNETKPQIAAAKERISEKASPLYQEAHALSVKDPARVEAIRSAIERDPRLRAAWQEAQAIARDEVDAGFANAAHIPNLSDPGGISIRGLDYLQQGLRSLAEKSRNSRNPITRKTGQILNRKISNVIALADEEVPQFAQARSTYKEARQAQKSGLVKQKETADFVLGGSPTQRIAKEQADFGGTASISDFSLSGLYRKVADSQLANWARGLDEATVDALAPVLNKELTPAGANDFVKLLRAFNAREEERRQRLLLPRVASVGVGTITGSQLRDKKR